MSHLPRLGHALRALLQSRRAAALATLGVGDGEPFVSMTPYAIDAAQRCLVIHVSGLAAHTANMAAHPRVSVLVAAGETAQAPVHDLARVTLEGIARTPAPESPEHASARAAYLARFPDAEMMTALPDFRFVTLAIIGARQVAGFGVARSVTPEEIAKILADDSV
ncbi:MAG: pyridoxamine 5'-phosphate oxidase family protein [Burkholderiaceae bacterium]|jgi:putative heme iron utilization protein|nr:pyridoxamine 5'-phosphate oxidase family protein [Burkholderiaceae bacterium]